MDTYPYARGDLINQRNTYFYTPYHGLSFLKAWKADRSSVKFLMKKTNAPLENEVFVDLEEIEKNINDGQVVKTEIVLDEIYKILCLNPTNPPKTAVSLVDRFVKKFEVNKRIHEAYGAGFRAINKQACKQMNLYLRAAEVFEISYSIYKTLPYLNVLLKCLDTLCALHQDLTSIQQYRLAKLIQQEWKHVKQLADARGVAL